MRARIAFVTLAALIGALVPAAVGAQPPPPPAAPAKPNITALMVEVTMARYLGEKRLSSTPYTMSVLPDSNRSSLRMGGDVPVPATTFTPAQKDDAKASTPIMSYSYRTIGTSMDLVAVAAVDGQYRITLTIEESSIYPADLVPATAKITGSPPSFRSYKSTNSLSLRDGQSVDYTMATDRLTGEVHRVTVKMTIVK